MAKKAKQVKKCAPEELAHIWMARIDAGRAWAADGIYFAEVNRQAYRAGLIYRTKREALACARRMLRAAKEG